jgi:hypothetical protein
MMQVARLLSFFASAASQLHGRSIARSIRQSVEGKSNPPERCWGIPIPTVGLFCILTCAFALGQVAGPVPAPPVNLRPVPTSRLYYDFLIFVTRIDHKAEQREKQNIDSEGMRNHQQKMLGFTDQEFAPIRATAHRLEAELKEIDDQEKAAIHADREAHPFQPETYSAVKDLKEEQGAAFEKEVSQLKHDLGASAANRLDIYIQTHIDPKSTTHLPQPPRASDEDVEKESLARYDKFLLHVYLNDQTADSIERKGGDGSRFRNAYQNALGFNDHEFALIRAAAQRVRQSSVDTFLDKGSVFKEDPASQARPTEMDVLRQKREDTITKEVADLKRILGPELSARLDDYVHEHFQFRGGSSDGSDRPNVIRLQHSPIRHEN